MIIKGIENRLDAKIEESAGANLVYGRILDLCEELRYKHNFSAGDIRTMLNRIARDYGSNLDREVKLDEISL